VDRILLGLGLLIFLAHLFGIVFQRTRIPDVLLLTGVGLLLGPVFGVVDQADLGRVGLALSGVALVTLLFEGGTTLDLSVLARALRPTMRLTLWTFGVTAVLAGATGWLLLDLPPASAAMLGCILGGTSSAVVIPLARGLDLGEQTATVLILESALTDVLCIVTTFALLQAVQQGVVAPFKMVGTVLSSMLFATLLGVMGGVAWMRVLPLVRRVPNTIFATVAFVFLVYGVTELLGFSGGIAALAFGVTIANPERFWWIEHLSRREGGARLATLTAVDRQFFAEIVFLLKTFFFVYLGQQIRFGEPLVLAAAALITMLVFLCRVVLTVRCADRDISRWDATVTSLMVPKGLAAAVLAALPLSLGIEGGAAIRDVAYAVVLFSIALTALLGWAAERAPLRRFYDAVFGRFGAGARAPAPSSPAS
jgi:NhaP-type Na+/H+ or K+/H+ antiporter